MLIEKLYRGEAIPATTDPAKVRQVQLHLIERLAKEMAKQHIWLAACTVAVNAGMFTGSRKRRRRLKLLAIINACAAFLGSPELVLPDRWESTGIYDGYGAIHKFHQETGVESNSAIFLGFLQAGLI